MHDEDFKRGLEQHGYPFQYRVIAECLDLFDKGRSGWKLLIIEFPVEVGGRDTRIDFILSKSVSSNVAAEDRYVIAECKRVNPAYSDWCFVKAPYWDPRFLSTQLILEVVRSEDHKSGGFGTTRHEDIYNVAFEMKSKATGDRYPVSDDRDAIEKSCTQVCRGLNGFVKSLMKERKISENPGASLLPVIFTTARLWTADAVLEDSNLETGSAELSNARELDLLFYQYILSPSLKHDLERGRLSSDRFQECFARDFVRTVAIVGTGGIGKFFRENWFSSTIGEPL